MSTYRSPPERLEPAIIQHPRSWLVIVLLTACFGPFFAVPFVFGRSTLTCSRASDLCTIEVVRGPEIWRSTREFRQSAIEAALVDDSPDSEGDRLPGIALRVNHQTVFIDSRSSVWNEEKQAWADKVNAYLGDTKRQSFEIQDGSTWPSYAAILVLLVVLAAAIRARTRFIVDYEQSIFRIEERIFRTSLEDLPLGDIVSVGIDEKDDGEGTILTGVALSLTDGTKKLIYSHSNIDRKIKAYLVERVDQALKQRPQ